jgi:hypothetical protein
MALLRDLLPRDTREANCYSLYEEYNLAMALASVSAEIKSPAGNYQYFLRMHRHVYLVISPVFSNAENKPGCSQLYILYSAEGTVKRKKAVIHLCLVRSSMTDAILPDYCSADICRTARKLTSYWREG